MNDVFDEGERSPEKGVGHAYVLQRAGVLVVVQTALEREDGALEIVLVEGQRLVDLEVEVVKGLQEEVSARVGPVALIQSIRQSEKRVTTRIAISTPSR